MNGLRKASSINHGTLSDMYWKIINSQQRFFWWLLMAFKYHKSSVRRLALSISEKNRSHANRVLDRQRNVCRCFIHRSFTRIGVRKDQTKQGYTIGLLSIAWFDHIFSTIKKAREKKNSKIENWRQQEERPSFFFLINKGLSTIA